MDKEYWDSYYKTHNVPGKPSPFAIYVGKEYFIASEQRKKLIELGCGDGRDSVYFEKIGLDVTAVEQSPTAIHNLNENYANGSIRFIEDDFTEFSTKFDDKFDFAYSRFTLHAVKDENEDKVLKWVFENLKEGGLFLLEVRSTKDELFGKGEKIAHNTFKYNNHNRRFVDFETIKNKISAHAKILESVLDNGLAVHKTEDPIVIRIIAQK